MKAKSNKGLVIGLLVLCFLIALVPLFALKGAEFGGSDDAGLMFCLQTGLGVGIIAFVMGRLVERKKWTDKQEQGEK